jgi:F-type H+-transporting ATPase subunit gamma
MANPRALVKRRRSVRNIRKITRTMQLIATARFQKALSKATASKPYAEKITELVQQLSSAGAAADHPLLRANAEAGKSALLVLTSNRGFCGGFNSALLRTAQDHLSTAQQPVDLFAIGKKGVNYFRFMGYELAQAVTDMPDTPTFTDVEPFAEDAMRRYEAAEYSSIHVVYQQFLSVAKQVPACAQLLPLRPPDSTVESAETRGVQAEIQYDFSPEPAELLAELMPATVKVRLFQWFMDNTVSEQVARMVAMKAATDAGDEMIKMLTRKYNRARQAQITNELLDIIGGAEALK